MRKIKKEDRRISKCEDRLRFHLPLSQGIICLRTECELGQMASMTYQECQNYHVTHNHGYLLGYCNILAGQYFNKPEGSSIRSQRLVIGDARHVGISVEDFVESDEHNTKQRRWICQMIDQLFLNVTNDNLGNIGRVHGYYSVKDYCHRGLFHTFDHSISSICYEHEPCSVVLRRIPDHRLWPVRNATDSSWIREKIRTRFFFDSKRSYH